MRRAARIAATAILIILLTVGTCAGILAAWARHTGAAGAFESPVFACLDKPDTAFRSGDLRVADRILSRELAEQYRTDEDRSLTWHAKQAIALLGLRLGYSGGERADLARELGKRMPDCPPRRRT